MNRLALSGMFLLSSCFLFLDCGSAAAIQQTSGSPETGTTMTLEQLQSPQLLRKARAGQADESSAAKRDVIRIDPVLQVTPMPLPRPALQYRLVPSIDELRPGNAGVHYGRALLLVAGIKGEALDRRIMLDRIIDDDVHPTAADIDAALAAYQHVFRELEMLRVCESSDWDLRIRDIKGVERFRVLLPEVQSARELARLLNFRILADLQQQNFESAFRHIQIGHQLADFMATGETLVQQLVAIAIRGIMQGCIEQAIRTGNCPNLWFALAMVAPDQRPINRAVELEISTIVNGLEVFQHTGREQWTSEQWQAAWRDSLEEFEKTVTSGAVGSVSGPKPGAMLASFLALETGKAKERLLERGMNREAVEGMVPERAVAILAQLEIRERVEPLLVAARLPWPAAREMLAESESRLDANPRGFAAMVTGILTPAVSQMLSAHHRIVARHHLLMTVEAVRDYMASHDGQLPPSLDEIRSLPLLPDPATGAPVAYSVAEQDGVQTASLSIDFPNLPERMRTIRLRAAK